MKSIVKSLPILSGIGSDRKNPAFASRQTAVRPQTSQFLRDFGMDSVNLDQNNRRRIIPTIVSFTGMAGQMAIVNSLHYSCR